MSDLFGNHIVGFPMRRLIDSSADQLLTFLSYFLKIFFKLTNSSLHPSVKVIQPDLFKVLIINPNTVFFYFYFLFLFSFL